MVNVLRDRVVVTLWLAAVLLYAPLVLWGLPNATGPDRIKTWATDEILPLEGLAEMRSTFVGAAQDRNVNYPWWHYAVVSAAQAPYLAGLYATGGMTAPTADYPYGLSDPVRALRTLTVVGRLVTVVMAAGIVVASFLFTSTFWGRPAGALAAVLTLLCFPLTYYGRTGNLDAPAFFWTALAVVTLARMLKHGVSPRRALWLGVWSALAVATKDQAVVVLMPICLVPFLPQVANTPRHSIPWKALFLMAFAGLVGYAAATGMLVDPGRHIAHVDALLFHPERVANASYFQPAPRNWQGTWELLSGTVSGIGAWWSWPAVIAAAAGAWLAIRNWRWHVLWLVPVVTSFVALVWLPGHVVLRYFLPITLFIDAFAALALLRLRAASRPLFAIALTVLLLGRLLPAADLAYAEWRDTRYDAGVWLQAAYQPGDRIEYFGVSDKMPPLGAGIVARRIMGRERWTGQFDHGPAVLQYLRTGGPRFVVVIPDWTSPAGLERSSDCPPEVLEALMNGQAGYDLAAEFRPPVLVPAPFGRPRLDNPSVAPPVRIFRRRQAADAPRLEADPPGRGLR
jgi:4-amino-4-deoxy-L-arabinose transferase-like glycosyltransferase